MLQFRLYQHAFHLSHYLLISEVIKRYGITRATGYTDTTALAEGFINLAHLFLLVKGDSTIRTYLVANLATGATSLINNGSSCLNLYAPLANDR